MQNFSFEGDWGGLEWGILVNLGGGLNVNWHGAEDRAYTSADMDVICGRYASLLKALAAVTPRVSSKMVTKASRNLFSDTAKAHNDFGSAIASALSHCFRSGKMATTGEKLSEEVMACC